MTLGAFALSVALAASPKAPAAPPAPPAPPVDPVQALRDGVKDFLSRYAAKDLAGVVALFEPRAPLFLGTDLGESCNDLPCIQELLSDRFQVWETATISDPARIHVEAAPPLGTAWFDTELDARSGGTRRKTKLRFATTWRLDGTQWKMTQVLLAVPTVGQSGKEILRQNELN
ncbi:MAG: hypothetical protein RL653_3347 [Pseudomonadota bacterium]